MPFNKDLPTGLLNLGNEIAKIGGTAIFVLQENCDNQVAIITFNPDVLSSQKIKIIPTNKIGDFGGFMNMPEKIATQTLVLFQIQINGKTHQICGSHQLAPTSITQRIISRAVEMALLTTKNKKLEVKVALGDHNLYGINTHKPFFEISNFIIPNLPYAFLIPVLTNFLSNNIASFAQKHNLQKLQTLPQIFNKNIQEIKIVRELCELVGLVYSNSKEPSFPSFYLDMIMTKLANNLEIGEIFLSNVSDHRIAPSVIIKKYKK